ncbi:hypothetical protein [Streptomyces rimosus]|uniref:hypothetical protein n=1 Tax=Streptomyces rimosus TaxID=1927 RepID=UPI0037A1A16B
MTVKYRMISAAFLLGALVTVTACGSQKDERAGEQVAKGRGKVDEQQAVKRADEIIRQAVEGMSPKPTLKPAGNWTGPCLARNSQGSDDRLQVTRSYQLTGVPGHDAKKLVRQARDAWVNQGYKFHSADSDGDWAEPFPSVGMRTEPDDFWMEALVGVLDRKTGDGLAAIKVTSPCFAPTKSGRTHTERSALQFKHHDEESERRLLAHSSRIFDALRAPYAPEHSSRLRTVRDADGTWLHHAWTTAPLSEGETIRAMERVQVHLMGTGWTVRHLETDSGTPAVAALHANDRTVAQVAPSTSGSIRVTMTGPAAITLDDTDV